MFKTAREFINYITCCPEDMAKLFTTAEEFIKLAGVNGKISCDLVKRQSSHIARLFKTPEQFIELARVDGGKDGSASHQLVEEEWTSAYLVELFKTFEQFMKLARVKGDTCLGLTRMQSDRVAPLFTNAEQFIELTGVDGDISYCLAENPDTVYIASLFKTPEQFIRLAEVDGFISRCLANHQPVHIASLFKTPEQFIELARAHAQTAYWLVKEQSEYRLFKTPKEFGELKKVLTPYLREIGGNIEWQKTTDLSENGCSTFFTGSTTRNTTPTISSTSEQEVSSTTTCGAAKN